MPAKTTDDKAAQVREEISQAVAAYLRDTEPAKQSLAGFAKHIAKG
jgi:hypothetical protein